MTLQDLRAQALSLDLESRAALAEALLESLEQPSENEIFQLALDEAERRQAEVRRGDVEMLDGEVVMRRLTGRSGSTASATCRDLATRAAQERLTRPDRH